MSPALARTLPWLLAPCCLGAGLAIGAWLWPGGRLYREAANGPAATLPSLAPMVAEVSEGIVAIRAFFPAEPGQADQRDTTFLSGSGLVVNEKGLVVTARHVVAGAERITVQVGTRPFCGAVLVGQDELTDIAVLRLVDPPYQLQALPLGASEELRAGDWIVTVSCPFGLNHTVTTGVVSHVGRHLTHGDTGVTNDYVQFTAPVYRGSSGCPVFDVDGRVVGVTTQSVDDRLGMSFAVPSRTIKWLLDKMEQHPEGRVRRGFLGMGFESLGGFDQAGRVRPGARITRVIEGEPAHRAGLRPGDVVVLADERAIDDAGDLHDHITRSTPGAAMKLTVLRLGRRVEPIEVTVGELRSHTSG